VLILSLTITEGGDAVDGQIQTGDPPATGPPPYWTPTENEGCPGIARCFMSSLLIW
jgi:hypothetical protein